MPLDAPWNQGFSSIQDKQKKYRYFKLTYPPQDPGLALFYVQAQRKISQEIEASINLLNNWNLTERSGSQVELGKIAVQLDVLATRSLEKEAEVFARILKANNSTLNDGQYMDYYYKMTLSERVNFWTKYMLGIINFDNGGIDIENLSNRVAFSLIIGSENFYEAVKGSTNIFTRHGLIDDGTVVLNPYVKGSKAAQNSVTFSQIIDKLDSVARSTINSDAESIITNAILEATMSYKEGKTMESKKGINITAIQSVRDYRKNSSAENQTYTAATFSQHLKEQIAAIMTANNINHYELKNDSGKVFLSISLGEENLLYSTQKGKIKSTSEISNLLKYGTPSEIAAAATLLANLSVEGFQAGIIKTFSSIPIDSKNGNYILNLLSLGKVEITKEVIQSLENKCLVYCSSDFFNFLKSQGWNAVLKTFRAYNGNQYISGLCGELRAANAFDIGGFKSQMTGSVYEREGFMDYNSVNDIVVRKKKSKSGYFGINVKHYISAGNDIRLYPASDYISLKGKAFQKYFSQEEIDLMKWVIDNHKFIGFSSGEWIEDLGYSLGFKNLSAFVRISEHSSNKDSLKNSVSNLFFLINNVLYPTSYVYEQIRMTLEAVDNQALLSTDKNVSSKDRLFDVQADLSDNGPPDKFETRPEAVQFYDKKAERYESLNRIEDVIRGDLKIKFNGIKINLMTLNLFK